MKRTASLLLVALLLPGCASRQDDGAGSAIITIDGSSTVFPVTEAAADEFQKSRPGVKVTVGLSGTGGGFKKFVRGETDVTNASRPILQKEIDDVRFEPRPGRRLKLGLSIGTAIFPHDGDSYEALLATADNRMYQDKGARKTKLAAQIAAAREAASGF